MWIQCYILFNILALAAFSLYEFKQIKHHEATAFAYSSVLITFILLDGVIVYHVALLIRKDIGLPRSNEYHPQPAQCEVTHSVIELHKHDQQAPSEAVSQD